MASGCRITWRTSSSLMTKWTMIARAPDSSRSAKSVSTGSVPRRAAMSAIDDPSSSLPGPAGIQATRVWSHSRPCSAISCARRARLAGARTRASKRVQPPFVSPVGHDLGQRRAARRVRIDVERDVLAALAGPTRTGASRGGSGPSRAGTPPCGARSGPGRRPAPRSRSPRRPRGAASAPRRGCGSRRARRPRPPPARARPPPRYRHRRPAGRPARWTARSSRPAWRRGRGPACRRARRRSAAAARIP